MRGTFETLKVIVLIALRNLFASRLKTFIVGAIILGGSLLVVVGTSLVDSVDVSMSRSVIGSVAGHIQVYSADSKDELAVMGGMNMESPDLAALDFAALRKVLGGVPNVDKVVPMGLSASVVTAGNTVDLVLEELRDTVRRRDKGESVQEAYDSAKDHARQIVTVFASEIPNLRKIRDASEISEESLTNIARAASPEFWVDFDKNALAELEFLENKIAPLATDADMLFLRYVGTDPDAFAGAFDRMKIVEGTPIPRGRRGFLFSKWVYEEQIKLKIALRMDKIHAGLAKRGRTLASDPELQRFAKQNVNQVKEIILQLDGRKTALFRTKLQKELASSETDVHKLLAELFDVNDANFDRRYRFFYDELAPSLQLYRVRVGDTLTIKSFTHGGYVQSVKVKIYGVFTFQGLEESTLAGGLNMMDLVSFRDLYGFMTPDREREVKDLKVAAGFKEVSRENAEAELFGTKDEGAEDKPSMDADAVLRNLAGQRHQTDRFALPFDPAQVQRGDILNAAVMVKDPRKITQTIKAIEAAGARAGMPLRAITWQAASGVVGQFVTMIRAILYGSVLIIFAVALVIVNNALVMATLERVPEIGTLRAVGAQRRFLLGMLLVESLAVGVLFGSVGAGLGALVVSLLRAVGIPATNDIFAFLFSGPRLHPTLSPGNILVALAIVLIVSAASSVYPGFLAMRVSPRQAMQSDE